MRYGWQIEKCGLNVRQEIIIKEEKDFSESKGEGRKQESKTRNAQGVLEGRVKRPLQTLRQRDSISSLDHERN